MTTWNDFLGANAGYALDLYERFQQDPASVDAATRDLFARLGPPPSTPEAAAIAPALATPAQIVPATLPATPGLDVQKVVLAARLARGIREYGHLAARVDPLGSPPPGDPMLESATHGLTEADLAALPASIVWPAAGPDDGSFLQAIERLRAMYCGSTGYDFDHVQAFEERAWLHESVESGRFSAALAADEQREVLQRLTEVEGFERFLASTFPGQKRFSIEGLDMLVPMLDLLIREAAGAGVREVLLGMAHRGRLNVLAHILGKPYVAIFTEFHLAPNKELVPSEGSTGINFGWTGDVKYHLGAARTLDAETRTVRVTLSHNPSHLEFVNPVVQGFTRAAQDDRSHPGAPMRDTQRAVAILVHGDAAFPGEGVVAEALNLGRLPGYTVGGAIHIVANNQIGFTTTAQDGRSTLYASDLAKGFEIPIVHVSADDPEACLATARMAAAYRERFGRDFLIDLVGYRRWGHNEGDEPAYTQPRMYAAIGQHPTVRALYAERIQAPADEATAALKAVETELRAAADEVRAGHVSHPEGALDTAPALAYFDTAVSEETLRALNEALLARPEGFTANSKLERTLGRRRDGLDKPAGIDWAHAEALAFASLLADGVPIRLTGQDAERGTFSQRHLVLHDAQTGDTFTPLAALPQARASFAVHNSPLSEAAVIGFDYGYSVHAPEALVLWEAQFGDFANAGQVLIDQFIAAARAKWRQLSSLVLLLPHGYEGQGPEHSSARLERYLQLAAEDNLRIAMCSSAAQYYHLLRAQAASLASGPRPLVVMTPKSLLRAPRASSSLADLTTGLFQPVLPETAAKPTRVTRLVLCAGKVTIDLATAREQAPDDTIAVARVEQLYPFPGHELGEVIGGYQKLREIVWLQEEPQNMGAWSWIAPRLRELLPDGVQLRYAGRPERASTAEGDAEDAAREQSRLITEALAHSVAAQPTITRP